MPPENSGWGSRYSTVPRSSVPAESLHHRRMIVEQSREARSNPPPTVPSPIGAQQPRPPRQVRRGATPEAARAFGVRRARAAPCAASAGKFSDRRAAPRASDRP